MNNEPCNLHTTFQSRKILNAFKNKLMLMELDFGILSAFLWPRLFEKKHTLLK